MGLLGKLFNHSRVPDQLRAELEAERLIYLAEKVGVTLKFSGSVPGLFSGASRNRGSGTLANTDGTIGPADYELDGYVMRPGAVVASGELRMPSAALARAFERRDVRLVTAEGRTLPLRFTGKPSDRCGDAAHIDISEGLPDETEWRRLVTTQQEEA